MRVIDIPDLKTLAWMAQKMMHRRSDFDSLLANPLVLAAIHQGKGISELPVMTHESIFTGSPVYQSPHIPAHPKKWEFPVTRFVEYEASDETWARPVRFGREVDDKEKFVVFSFKNPFACGNYLAGDLRLF